MLAKAIEKIQELTNAQENCRVEECDIFGERYIHQGENLTRFTVPRINPVEVKSLTALNEMIKNFIENDSTAINVHLPVIITAEGNNIKVYTSIDNTYGRQLIFEANPIIPKAILNRFIPAEQMIINVNTCFVQDKNTDNFIQSISKLYKVSKVEAVDNGIGAQLKVTEGVNTNEAVTINPIVALTPIGTYPELNQIRRKFNLRVDHDGEVALMVCDEGIFERRVQDELKDYFKFALDKEIERKDASIISKFQRGIVYETRADFPNSVFNKVYKRAYALVDKDVQIQLRDSQELDYKSTPNNIITFVGRRGTGKSSAMQSFMHALLNNTKNPEREPGEYTIYDNSRNPKPVQFIGIDWIDASLLEKGEDIFEVILAKMLKVFLEDIESESNERLSYEKRTLYNSFADIYKKQLNIKKQNDNYYSAETAISSLRDLSRSVDIKDEFQKLVYNFINIKSENSRFERDDLKETFLVVAIDDIDMNIDSGFEILEKIQRYLSVDRFLILLAVNHEQMELK